MWNYKLTLKFRTKIKEQFVTHDIVLVTLLVKFRNKDYKTTVLGLLLQVLPVRIVTFVETLGSHLKHSNFRTITQVLLIFTTWLTLPLAESINKNLKKVKQRLVFTVYLLEKQKQYIAVPL